MAAKHYLAGEERVLVGLCPNGLPGVPVVGAGSFHFPYCDRSRWGDGCYCRMRMSTCDAEHHWMMLSKNLIMCDCGDLPEMALTHGQMKHLRDERRRTHKRLAGRYLPEVVKLEARLDVLFRGYQEALGETGRVAAMAQYSARVAHFQRFASKRARSFF